MANKSDRKDRKPLKLKTGSFDRNAAMARMGVMAGASFAGHTLFICRSYACHRYVLGRSQVRLSLPKCRGGGNYGYLGSGN